MSFHMKLLYLQMIVAALLAVVFGGLFVAELINRWGQP